MKKLIFAFVIAIFALFVFSSAFAAEVTGKVVKIYDGDTIKIEDADGGKFKIRFADIDAPEKDQPFGLVAKDYLSGLIGGKVVRIHFTTIDQYGRIVGSVYLGKVCINEMLVRNGCAWWYKAYSKNTDFGKMEREAKRLRIGLWEKDDPVPPWHHRKAQRDAKGGK